MTILRRILSIWVLCCFLGTTIILPPVHAQATAVDATDLPFHLPKPGSRVNLSPTFEPALIKGLKVHPENPFVFDFIVDSGDEQLSADDFKKTAQRMVNYFLASLTVPQKDVWVNLSPVEKNHIIPDSLNKTELGRDLLAEDYMLKQVGASLIYPESNLGRAFWGKVYDEAYQKFGVTQIPVNVFNKIWILPEKASVFERGNTVYIVKAHLKVMLEEDYLAQKMLGSHINTTPSNVPVKDISKQVLREIVIPAIEKEVNEGKNFVQLRQIFYTIILAQWYQDAFKKSILNKDYAGRNKVAGIDVSNPKNKDFIYHQYLSAYKRGVFNYIKEETDRISQQPIPRKYFSGGFVERKVNRQEVSATEFAMSTPSSRTVDLKVNLDAAQAVESREVWNDLSRPLSIVHELKELLVEGKFSRPGLYAFIDKYSVQLANEKLYPVQGAWPVLKAITTLSKAQEEDLIAALQEKYSNSEHPDANRPELVDKIYLMNSIIDREKWLEERAPHLVGRRVYLAAAEIHHWAGGLGPVMKFHGKGMQDLGADVAYIEPWYQLRRDKGNPSGDPLDYTDPDVGLRELNENFDAFDVQVGDVNGTDMKTVHVKVATAIDENGIRVYMFKDVGDDGASSFYTRMLYNYGGQNNPISKEESMAFLSVASAELIKRLEVKRKEDQKDQWKPAIVHANDGQYAPLQAVAMSRYGSEEVIKNIFWAFTTHTYRNRGNNNESRFDSMKGKTTGTINIFLKHMMGVKDRYVNAFRQMTYIDFTSGGIRLAEWAGVVSDKHGDDMRSKDPHSVLVSVTNGAVPEEMAAIFREEFNRLKQEGKISVDADFERPTAREDALTKIEAKKRLNKIIPISKFDGIDFTSNPNLDPNNPNGIWEKVSPTEVRLKKGIDLSEEHFRRIAGNNFEKIGRILYQYQGIKTVTGASVQVDLDKPMIGYARRLVEEKAGRNRAFNNENIWRMVRLGYNVVLLGNNQGTEDSRRLSSDLKKLEIDIAAEKVRNPGAYLGNFQFVESFTPEQKKIFLAAVDIQIQDSDDHTGAAEFSEEDSTSNGALQGGPRYGGEGEGVITQQGIEIDFNHPGAGQTLMPKHDTADSWFDSVYLPVMSLWNKDKDHLDFYKSAALSPRLNRIQRYLITSAAYLREYEHVLARKEQQAFWDKQEQLKIVQTLGDNQEKMNAILNNGHGNEIGFEFLIDGQGDRFRAKDGGLKSFLSKKNELEEKFGYDSFLGYFLRRDYQLYLVGLFDNNDSAELLRDWLSNLEKETGVSALEKYERFGQFVEGLSTELENKLASTTTTANAAMGGAAPAVIPGGIKFDHIALEHQGRLMTDVVSDQAFEGILLKSKGLYGVIVGITRIPNLQTFIQ